MKSATLPSFWESYNKLDQTVRRRARKAFELWIDNLFIRRCISNASMQKRKSGQ